MVELRRVRAIVAELTAGIPADGPLLDVGAVEREIAALAGRREGVEVRVIGVARDGGAIPAIGVGPGGGADAPGMLVVGVPRGDAPTGARLLLALARRLADDADLRAELGVRWWIVPCLDPVGVAEHTGWWEGPLALEGYARGAVAEIEAPDGAGEVPLPEQRALLDLIAAVRPRTTLFLYDAPVGGFALFAGRGEGGAAWRGREGDFFRLLDPLGLPLDLGGAFGAAGDALAPGVYSPGASSVGLDDPYERFRAELVRPFGTMLGQLGVEGMAVGAIVAPLFADYERRERDRTATTVARRVVVAEGIRLWREWFAFGRTALDLVAPLLSSAGLARSPAQAAVVAALRGAEAMLAEGLRWPALVPDAEAPASIAEAFAQGDAVRVARLPRLAALVRLLDEANARLGPEPPNVLAEALERARETQTRWIDEVVVSEALRPLPRDRAAAAQLGAILLALP